MLTKTSSEQRRAQSRRWYLRNRSTVIARACEWQRKHRQKHNKNCRASYQKNLERSRSRARVNSRAYYRRHPEKTNLWAKQNPELFGISCRKWEAKNRLKRIAHWKLRQAVRSGKILRPTKCSKCGKRCRPHGHHPNYDKPLEVKWLCVGCHKFEHRI